MRLLIFPPLDSQTYMFHLLGIQHPIMVMYLIECCILWEGTYPYPVSSENWQLSCIFKRLFYQLSLGSVVYKTNVSPDYVPTVLPSLL